MKKIERLEALARDLVGDGQKPDVFFVTDRGTVVCIETNADSAYARFSELARRSPRMECSMENRTWGVIADVSPESDDKGARLVLSDDFHGFSKRKAA